MKRTLIVFALICSCAYGQNQSTYTRKNEMSCDSTCLVSNQAVLNYTNTATSNNTYSQVVPPSTAIPVVPAPVPQSCQSGTQPSMIYGTNTPAYINNVAVCCPNGYQQQYTMSGQLLFVGNTPACIPIQTN